MQDEQARDFARSIVATVREPLLVLDGTLHVTFANRSFYTSFGVAPEETDGRLLYELGNGQWDIPALRHLLEEIIPQNNAISDFSVTHTFESIGTRTMLLNARKIRRPGDDSELLLLAFEDVTARLLLQESLRRNEQQLRLMVEGATDYAMFVVSEAGIVQSWNVGAERITGFSEAEIIGQPFGILFTDEDRAANIPAIEMERSQHTGRADGKRWHLRRDGSRFFADGVMTCLTGDDGKPSGYAKILRDVTDRILLAENLRVAGERLRFATEAAQVGAWDYDIATNELIWDARCRFLWGFAPDEPAGMDAALARVHPDDLPVFAEALDRAASLQDSGNFDVVYRVYPDGNKGAIRFIQAKGRALRGADGVNHRLIGILQDVSEQKRLQAEVLEAGRKNERIVETLQKSLLLAPLPDAFPGIAVNTLYESAWDDALIGGDFFDVFAVEENVIAVVVGDVTGKGLKAATYTAEIKFILRGFLRESGDPIDAMTRINRFMVDAERLDAAHLGSTYIALSLACINTQTGRLICATAGAEPPLLFRGDDSGNVEEVPPGGPMLGVAHNIVFDAHCYELGANDLYIAYTDGITEARRGKDFWGQEGLIDAVRDSVFERGASLSETADEIARRAKAFANGRQQDDVCLLLVRRTP
ncbi:MAG: SpoIIE family protein phosphatase [Armatimonadetes bacterium]|nr:SpoIIE family protein phosphatase [Armatimonadota bacterium]